MAEVDALLVVVLGVVLGILGKEGGEVGEVGRIFGLGREDDLIEDAAVLYEVSLRKY